MRLPTIIHCYLLRHCLKDGPVAAVIMANVVANVASLMSGATVLRMGKLAIGAKASIISKLSVVLRLQPRQDRALTEARSHSCLDVVPRGATMARAKEVATVCCDIGQIDIFSRIELFPLSSCQVIILIARMTFNCSTSCLMS